MNEYVNFFSDSISIGSSNVVNEGGDSEDMAVVDIGNNGKLV